MSKWCPKCKTWKDESEFHKNKKTSDGLTWNCRICASKSACQWQRDNRVRCNKVRKSSRVQEKDTQYKARHRAKHRDRHYARYQLQRAREKGLTLNYCSWPGCKETGKIEGHHPSYKKPHEIVPLCFLHHRAADLVGDKLGFTLPTIDISPYLKRSRRGRPRKDTVNQAGVAI